MTLTELCENRGRTLADVALLCGVAVGLFEGVDSGRQPLPLVVVDRMALVLGAERWEVVQAARSTTTATGARATNPLPFRPTPYLSQLTKAPELSTVTSGVTSTANLPAPSAKLTT